MPDLVFFQISVIKYQDPNQLREERAYFIPQLSYAMERSWIRNSRQAPGDRNRSKHHEEHSLLIFFSPWHVHLAFLYHPGPPGQSTTSHRGLGPHT